MTVHGRGVRLVFTAEREFVPMAGRRLPMARREFASTAEGDYLLLLL